jgi:hypothetical protein
MVIIKKNRDIAFSLSYKVSFCYRYSTLYVGRIPKHPIPLPAKPVLQTTCQCVDKTFPHSEGLGKKHKKWREIKVVNFSHSSSEEIRKG